MSIHEIKLRERHEGGREVALSWNDATGELSGDPDVVATALQEAAFAVEHGTVPVDPVPCSLAITDPLRERVQLAAVLAQLFVLPDDWRALLTKAVAGGQRAARPRGADVIFELSQRHNGTPPCSTA